MVDPRRSMAWPVPQIHLPTVKITHQRVAIPPPGADAVTHARSLLRVPRWVRLAAGRRAPGCAAFLDGSKRVQERERELVSRSCGRSLWRLPS